VAAAARQPAPTDPSLALWRDYRRTGDRALRERLVLTYGPLVKAVVGRKRRDMPPHADVEDFVSCGLEAVIHAIERYDPRRGTTLQQYVWTRVHGAILDELRRLDWAPRSVRRWQRDIARAAADFAAVHGRPPRPAETAQALGVTRAELRRRQGEIARSGVGSLNVAVPAHEHEIAGERIEALVDDDPAVDPLGVVATHDRRLRLRDAIEELPPRERRVAVLLYVDRLTMAEVGRVLGVSESRVSQLHRRLTGRLRKALDVDRALFVGPRGT
jgi:RNA polymerase sigma factor FliA